MTEKLANLLKKMGVDTELISEENPNTLKINTYNKSTGNLTDYDCNLCNNRGDFLKEKDGILYFTPCECVNTRKSLMRIEKSGLKNMLERYRPDNFNTDTPWQKLIYDKGDKFCRVHSGWFFIGGQPGCGKTHICTAIANHMLKKNMDTLYILWRDECIKLKSVITDSIDYNRLIAPLKKTPVLYIDDFLRSPGGMPSNADLGIAYELLNYRYNNNLITIISSEYTVEKIYEFDSAIAGRITEMCGDYILAVHYDKAKNMRDSINKLQNRQIQAKKQRNDLKNQNKPFT